MRDQKQDLMSARQLKLTNSPLFTRVHGSKRYIHKLRDYVCCKWFNMGACVSSFHDHDLSRFPTIPIISFNISEMASPSISKTKTRKRPVTYFRSLSASEYALKPYIYFNVAYFVTELLEISAISRPGQHFKDATRFHTRMSLKTSSPI